MEKKNVNKVVLLLVLTHSIFSFSQKKEDVYFILENDDPEYVINHLMYGEKIGFINLFNRKDYEYHQTKVKEAKNKGEYYYNPESGRDNLNIKVLKLTFKVLSRKKIRITNDYIEKLNLVDYNWILENSWKKLGNQPYDFKDIYFLYQMDQNEYISYKVGVTILSH